MLDQLRILIIEALTALSGQQAELCEQAKKDLMEALKIVEKLILKAEK